MKMDIDNDKSAGDSVTVAKDMKIQIEFNPAQDLGGW